MEGYRYCRRVVYRIIDGIGMALHIDTNVYCHMNETAALIWQELVRGKNVFEIAQLLSDKYDVSEEEAKRDVIELITEWQARGFIEKGVENDNEIGKSVSRDECR